MTDEPSIATLRQQELAILRSPIRGAGRPVTDGTPSANALRWERVSATQATTSTTKEKNS